ncbi:plasmid mobilization protein [Megasphaera sueciensis]|uniref:plasmid mobilization protein n=1 Tax=Megasphaera sueciensis TaxID=349094 RepID=UPI003D052769
MNDKANKSLNIRLDENTWNILNGKAKKAHLSKSEFVRAAIKNSTIVYNPYGRETIIKLASLHNEVNQHVLSLKQNIHSLREQQDNLNQITTQLDGNGYCEKEIMNILQVINQQNNVQLAEINLKMQGLIQVVDRVKVNENGDI